MHACACTRSRVKNTKLKYLIWNQTSDRFTQDLHRRNWSEKWEFGEENIMLMNELGLKINKNLGESCCHVSSHNLIKFSSNCSVFFEIERMGKGAAARLQKEQLHLWICTHSNGGNGRDNQRVGGSSTVHTLVASLLDYERHEFLPQKIDLHEEGKLIRSRWFYLTASIGSALKPNISKCLLIRIEWQIFIF